MSFLRSFFSSLRFRLIILVLFAISPSLIITLYTSIEEKNIATSQIKKEIHQLTYLILSNQNQLIEGIKNFLFIISQLPQVKIGDPELCPKLFKNFLKESPEYLNLGIANIKGDIIASGLPLTKRINISDRIYFKLALKTKRFSIGEYQIGRISGKPSINFGHPVWDNSGQLRGILFIALDLRWINKLCENTDLPQGSEISIIGQDGLILAHHPEPEKWVGRIFSNMETLKRSSSDRGNLYEANGLDGKRRFYASYLISNPQYSGNIYLSVGIPSDVVFSKVNKVLNRSIIILIIIGSLALFSAIIAGNLLILRCLNPIINAAKRLGSGDMSARTGVTSGINEITQIAITFDEMADSLEKKFQEQKRTQDALKKSEERFKEITNLLPDIIFETDDKGYLTFANQRAFEFFGYTQDDLSRGLNVFEMVAKEDYERAKESFGKALIGEISRDELNLITKDGKIFPAIIQASPIVRDGKPIGLRGVVVDISERKDIENKLRENMEVLKTFINSNPETMLLIDEKGTILIANETFCKRINMRLEEIIGTCLYDILPKDIAILRKSYIDKVFNIGRPILWEDMRQDRIYENHICPIFDENGNVSKISILGIDITERKKMEEDLKKSELKFRQLFDEAPIGYHEFDIEGRITEVNKTELNMLGYLKEEMIGHFIWEFTAEGISKQIIEAKISGEIPFDHPIEGKFRKRDGTLISVMITDRILHDSEGKVIGIRSTLQDLTKLKETEKAKEILEEQFRQSQKMEAIGRLAGGIAHDFNNLLTIIKGYSQLSLLGLNQNDPLRESLNEIQRAADRASNLTRQLLAFSRKQIMELKSININLIVRDLEKMLSRIIGEDIELILNLADDLGMVNADPGQIEQVIMNLVVNARDAMPEGGKLIIETANVELDEDYAKMHIGVKPGSYVMLSVSDTGIGMTREIREKIFEPFFTTKEKGKGTGLGLSTVFGIVKQSGGNIWVYSEPGHGSIFKIFLPREDKIDEKIVDKGKKLEFIPKGNETIIIVEDDDGIRNLAARILENQGYKVFVASEWSKAIDILKEKKDLIDLILIDAVMPEGSGDKLIERMREIRNDFKVLYMSGYIESNFLNHAILEKRINFIQKPFSYESLSRKVREVLDK